MIIDILRTIYLTLISLFVPKDNDEFKPVRLEKKVEKEPIKLKIDFDYKIIILLILFLIMFGILIYTIYRTGSLDSTNYYYRLHNL